MSNFQTAVSSNPECGVRFYLMIGGIPHVFLDGPTPVGPDGSAWSAPTSSGNAYTLQPHTLANQSIEDVGPEISRSTSDVSPASMAIMLQEQGTALLQLFGRDLSTGNRANLAASFGYNDASPPSVMTVDSTTGWDTSGFIYFGRETIKHTGKTSTTFTGLTRDLFGIGDEDTSYTHQATKPGAAPRVVTDYPRVWRGRYVRLFAFVVDHDGRAYDSAFGGSYSCEIFRGVIRTNPVPNADYFSWTLDVESIEGILRTEVGPRTEVKGTLIRVPGGVDSNKAGEVQWTTPESGGGAFWLDVSTQYIHLKIVENASGTITEADWTGPNAVDLLGAGASNHQTAKGVALAINNRLNTVIQATFADITVGCDFTEDGRFRIRWDHDKANTEYSITIDWDRYGSVGYLIGYSGVNWVNIWDGVGVTWHSVNELLAAYVHPQATSIPFYYEDTDDLAEPAPPEPGYAVIGSEVVSYTSISSANGTATGLRIMEGCRRGLMGTFAQDHLIKLDDNLSADGDEVEIRFGPGFASEGEAVADKTTITDALLQLAVSTGEGHHGSYDTLAGDVSVPLNPNHFDDAQWASTMASIPGQLRWVDHIQAEAEKLAAMGASWLQPLGMFLYGGIGADLTYKIRIGRILGYLEGESATSLGESDTAMSDPAQYVAGSDRIINEIKANLWDVVKGEASERFVLVTDDDSQSEHGERGSLEWVLRGYRFSSLTDSEIRQAVGDLAAGVFRRFSQPFDLFRVRVGRAGWFLNPGASVLLTVAGVPTSTGARGMTERPAVVLQASKRYMGDEPGADLLCIVEPEVRRSSYVPSGLIASYSSGTPSITLAANSYTTTDTTDAAHFAVGDYIWVYNQAGDVTRDLREIVAINGNIITISSALSSTPSIGAPVTGADYASVVAAQRKHAYIADGSTPPVLTVGDTTAFKYVA